MTNPGPTPHGAAPQPRDIVLEEATPEQVEHLEVASDPEDHAAPAN